MAKNSKYNPSDELSFFNQHNYQENAGLITSDLKNPNNQELTEEDLENVNTFTPPSFVQDKLNSDKSYQIPSKFNDSDNNNTILEDDEEALLTSDAAEQKGTFSVDEIPNETKLENKDAEQQNNNDNLDDFNFNELNDNVSDKNDISSSEDNDITLNSDELSKLISEESSNDQDTVLDDVDNNIENDSTKISKLEEQESQFITETPKVENSEDSYESNEVHGEIDNIENNPATINESNENSNLDEITDDFFEEDKTKQSVQNTDGTSIDENELYNKYNQTVNSEFYEEYKKKELKKVLATYKPKNRELILQCIQHRKIDEEQINQLITDITKNTNEALVIETLNQQLFKKTGYEFFERRDRQRSIESAEYNESFSNYQRKRFIAGISVISMFLLILVLSIYFSYETILTYRLYQKAIAAAEDEQYQEAELFFDEAYTLKPQVTHTKSLAEIYLEKKQLNLAKDKYHRLLSSFPNNPEVLVANSRFYRITEDFNRSKSIIDLGEKKIHQHVELIKEKAEVLLAESFTLKDYTEARKNWLAAEKVFSDLLVKDKDRQALYIQRKLEVAAIEKDFLKSKNYFIIFNRLKEKYDLQSMTRYLDFLIETQEHIGDSFYQVKPETLTGVQNVYIVSIIEKIIRELENTYGKHYLIDIQKARWAQRKNNFNQAMFLIDSSINAIATEKNFLLNNHLVKALNTAGMIEFHQNQVVSALEYFQKTLEINPNNHLANYYMGKINLTVLNQTKKSKEYFSIAFKEWFNPNDKRYIDLQYSLGYINFLKGKSETNPQNQELYFKSSIDHWSQLLKNKLPEKNYLIVFNLATTYLYLKEYQLAQIYFESNLEELKPILNFYQNKSDLFVQERSTKKEELLILSDVFNNLAVAQIKSLNENLSPSETIPGVAVENLINAITIKDKLGVLKGIPYANFNTINDYPKYSEAFTTKRLLLIGDSFIPNSMFAKTF